MRCCNRMPDPSPLRSRRSAGCPPSEAADWPHQQLGGRKRSAAAIRKVIRTGIRGVVLKSFPYGHERRTTEADLRQFVAQIGAVPHLSALEHAVRITPAAPSTLQVKSSMDPADEIAAAQERFRSVEGATPKAEPRHRRAARGT